MDYNNKKRVAQFKKVSTQEKDELMKRMVAILRTKDLNDEENDVVEKAEVAIIDYETLKQRVYDCKTIEGLTDITRKYGVVPESFLAQYIQRRAVWLRAFEYKNNKTPKEKVISLLNRYKNSFRKIDYNKVITFINSENYGENKL